MKKLKCPKGHELPHSGEAGRCTTTWCGAVASTALVNVKASPKSGPTSGVGFGGDEEKGQTEAGVVKAAERDVMYAQARARVRAKALGLDTLARPTDDDLEGYALKKATSLLPEAMAEIEYQLKYGNDGQRKEAALDVLDMTGNRKRDAVGGGAHTIYLTFAPGDAPQWAGGARFATINGQPMEKGYVKAKGEGAQSASLAEGTVLTLGEEERARAEAVERRKARDARDVTAEHVAEPFGEE